MRTSLISLISVISKVGWAKREDLWVKLGLGAEKSLDGMKSGRHRGLGWCAGYGYWYKSGIWGVIGCTWRVGAGRLTEADPRERCAVWKGWMWYECSLPASDSQGSS